MLFTHYKVCMYKDIYLNFICVLILVSLFLQKVKLQESPHTKHASFLRFYFEIMGLFPLILSVLCDPVLSLCCFQLACCCTDKWSRGHSVTRGGDNLFRLLMGNKGFQN